MAYKRYVCFISGRNYSVHITLCTYFDRGWFYGSAVNKYFVLLKFLVLTSCRLRQERFCGCFESACLLCPVLVLPCVHCSTDQCWTSRDWGVFGAGAGGGERGETVSVIEYGPRRPVRSRHGLLHPSLVILDSVTWMNNRDVQRYRLPCC